MPRPGKDTTVAFAPLYEAMRVNRPACGTDERYIDDKVRMDGDPEEIEDMERICASCPLLDACSEFAVQARPSAGFWAGAWRGGEPRPLRRNGGDPL